MQMSSEKVIFAGKAYLKINLLVKTLLEAPGNGLLTWYSILFDHKLTKLFSIENFSGAKHAGKVLIIIIKLF